MPYDHKNTTPSGLQSQKMKLMLETLNHLHCGDRCVVGSGGGSVGSVLNIYFHRICSSRISAFL